MDIATFGPSSGWVGKRITYTDGQFSLEDFGLIAADAVVGYDRQGHLVWAYDGLREWAYELAGQPAPAPPAAAAPVAAPAAAQAPVTPTPAEPATPVVAQPPVTPPAPAEVTAATVAPAAAVTPPPTAPVPPTAAGALPPQPPAAAVPTAAAPAAAPPAATSSSGWAGWVIVGVAVVVALVIGIVAAGGRLRDGLGIALTLLAGVFIVLLIVSAIRPTAAGRWFAGLGGRTVLVACGVLAAGCFVLAAFLWWVPHYEVVAPSDKRIALDETPEFKVVVVNHGLLGGTFKGDYSVDGVRQDSIDVPLGAGEGREVILSLPSGVERGNTLISLGGAGIEAKAVAPPAFTVAELQLEPAVAKVGDSVALQTTVTNTGDMAGTFDGVLTVDGEELLKQPVEVGPGATKAVTYDLTADSAGDYRLALGDAGTRFVIVQPVRLANGYVIKRSAKGGRAYMTITNETGADAVAVLTRSGSTKRAVVAVYIRKGKKAKIKGIPDGKYVLWDNCGTDWNWEMRDFYATEEYKRWLSPLKFDTTASTKYWTSYWSDYSYNYSQKHSQTTTHWTNWKVTLGTGPSKYSKAVTAGTFPQL